MKMRYYLLISICVIVSIICNAQEKNSVFLQNEFWKLKWTDKDINDEIYYFMNDGHFYNASIPLRTGIFYCLYSFGRYEYDVLNEVITLYTEKSDLYANFTYVKPHQENEEMNILIKNLSNDSVTVRFETNLDDKVFFRQENKSVFFVPGSSMYTVDSILLRTEDNLQFELTTTDQSEILNILRNISYSGYEDGKTQVNNKFNFEVKSKNRSFPFHIKSIKPHMIYERNQYDIDDKDFVRLTEILEKYRMEN